VEQRTAFTCVLAGLLFCAPLMAAPEDALAHLGAGLRLFDMQRYSEASREFELALAADPNLLDARYHLAVSYFNERRYPDSRQQFERLLTTGHRKDWASYYLGRIDLLDGELDLAIQRFESLKSTEPLQDEWYYLGSAYMKKGEPGKAIPPLRRQVEFNPRDFRAHSLLARAYVKMGYSQEAEREFQESERLHDYYLQGKQELLECHEQLAAGHAEQAWAHCGSALQADDIDKLVAAGMLFGQFASYDHALQLFEKALALDPESPEVNYNLGFTHFQKKDYPRARKFLEVAVQLRPNFFEAPALKGSVLYLLGDNATALDALRRAHRLRPDDVAVTKLLAQLEKAAER
jgi:tetratricopeptide (TPR) repeat protein